MAGSIEGEMLGPQWMQVITGCNLHDVLKEKRRNIHGCCWSCGAARAP
jgi:hypothetical protein